MAIVSDDIVDVASIVDADRIRRDMGDMDVLVHSVKEFGIIQPIVLTRQQGQPPVLVAGGRRLEALRRLGMDTLTHGKEFVWRQEAESDVRQLRLQAVELEENLKRQDLHWSETIIAKKRLMALMQSIHGPATMGRGQDGFGVRSLAAMLGENHSTTSRDLELAGFVEKHPMLAKLPTRADAQRKLGVALTVAAMQSLAKKSTVPSIAPDAHNVRPDGSTVVGGTATDGKPFASVSIPGEVPPALIEERWMLYEGRFQDNIAAVDMESVDLICTDLPYNIGLGDSSAAHSAGLGGFTDSDIDISVLCSDVATQSYRVLRENRFAVFFYGAAYHQILFDNLIAAGFIVDAYPFIWLRDRSAPPDGFARYSKSYDPALIASKGTPRFIRPNLPNHLAVASVRGAERLHAAQKPVAVMQKFIEDMTTPGCIVLDMFAGAGTTGVAALRTKRKAILFELEPSNCVLIRSQMGVL